MPGAAQSQTWCSYRDSAFGLLWRHGGDTHSIRELHWLCSAPEFAYWSRCTGAPNPDNIRSCGFLCLPDHTPSPVTAPTIACPPSFTLTCWTVTRCSPPDRYLRSASN